MRILQLIDSLDSGGAERMAVNYANILSQENISFICSTRNEGLLKYAICKEVNYLFLDKKRTLDFKALKQLHKYIRKHKIEIIHAHSTSFFTATLIKIFNRKIKLIWHDHYGNSEFLKNRKFNILKVCSYKFNAIISVNKALKNWALKNLQCEEVSILNNFATINTNEIRRTVLKGEEGKRIVCLANLRPQKNHFMLLNAFNEVRKINKEWTLHLIGKDRYDNYSLEIKKRINTLNLNNNVFIYGSKSDTNNILNQCDIGVLSSKSEGLPLALLEYGLAKLPVVSTNVGDCNKVITQSTEGFLIDSGNSKEFSKAILKYIDSKELRIKKAESLFLNIDSNFGEKKIKNQLIEIYSKLKP